MASPEDGIRATLAEVRRAIACRVCGGGNQPRPRADLPDPTDAGPRTDATLERVPTKLAAGETGRRQTIEQ